MYASTAIASVSLTDDHVFATLLNAAYEGTYACAVIRQSRQLVLTLIGGGCFNNPPALIAAAIARAHARWADRLHEDCRVMLPIYTAAGAGRPVERELARLMGDRVVVE